MCLQVNPNSKAYNEGVQSGDHVESINERLTGNLRHDEALQLIRNANKKLVLELSRLVLTTHFIKKKPNMHNFILQKPKIETTIKTISYYLCNENPASDKTLPHFIRTLCGSLYHLPFKTTFADP